jgi:hypothetical protein
LTASTIIDALLGRTDWREDLAAAHRPALIAANVVHNVNNKESVARRNNVDLANAEHQENIVFTSTVVRMVHCHYKGAVQTTHNKGFMQNVTTRKTFLDENEDPPTTLKNAAMGCGVFNNQIQPFYKRTQT